MGAVNLKLDEYGKLLPEKFKFIKKIFVRNRVKCNLGHAGMVENHTGQNLHYAEKTAFQCEKPAKIHLCADGTG